MAATPGSSHAVFANDDLLNLICAFALETPGWWMIHRTCKRWRAAADAEQLWRDLCYRQRPATARLVGVTSHKTLAAQLMDSGVTSAGTPEQQPQLEEYQFLVRLEAGDRVLLDEVLSGRDAASGPPFPWTISAAHRRVLWPVAMSDFAVPAACSQDAERMMEYLDEVAERPSDNALNAAGQAPWKLSIDTFRARDQRYQRIMINGVVEENCIPSDRIDGWQGVEFVSSNDYSTCHLDAAKLKQEGVVLKDAAGDAWHIEGEDDDEDAMIWPICIQFAACVIPRIMSPGKLEWSLELELMCSGDAAITQDGQGNAGHGMVGALQHELMLRALDELGSRQDAPDE